MTLGALCAQGQSLLFRHYPDPYRQPWNYNGYGWYGGYGYGYGGMWQGVGASAVGAAIAIGAIEANRRLEEAAERRRTERTEPAAGQIRYEDCKEFRGEKSRILKCTDSKGRSVTFEIPN
jgi:hypothetical protein